MIDARIVLALMELVIADLREFKFQLIRAQASTEKIREEQLRDVPIETYCVEIRSAGCYEVVTYKDLEDVYCNLKDGAMVFSDKAMAIQYKNRIEREYVKFDEERGLSPKELIDANVAGTQLAFSFV